MQDFNEQLDSRLSKNTAFGDNQPVFSLGELSQSLKRMVEGAYDQIRVRAEISRPVTPASGHIYFTLKDGQSTLDSVCWKSTAGRLNIMPADGLEVIATGQLTTYPGRSKYQLIVKELELAGEGAILKMLEERKAMLKAEGLFEDERKKDLPNLPRVIGVITSPTGAVIRDIIHRLRERFPTHVLLWPVLVQGEGAAAAITSAIKGFDALLDAEDPVIPIPDLLIVARGGGSLEDLMAFNDEAVVRAVAACRLPLISAVGHETDTTLIDHVSDYPAATPTAAAEHATPVKAGLEGYLDKLSLRLNQSVRHIFEKKGEFLKYVQKAISDPEILLHAKAQQLDIQVLSLTQASDNFLASKTKAFQKWGSILPPPDHKLTLASHQLERALQDLDNRFKTVIAQKMANFKQSERLLEASSFERTLERNLTAVRRTFQDVENNYKTIFAQKLASFNQNERLLEASSFERTLERGFAVVTDNDGKVMHSNRQFKTGDLVSIRLRDGTSKATIAGD